MDDQDKPSAVLPESPLPTVDSSPTPPGQAPNWLFGPDGLRAGWCLLLYYIVFRFLARAVGEFAFRAIPANASRLWDYIAGEFSFLLAALLAAAVMTLVEKHKFTDYGLPPRRAFGRLFWVGGAWGLVSISVMLGAMHGAHLFDFGQLELHGIRLWKFAAFWGLFFLLVGLYEEFYFRGYMLFTLSRGLRGLPRLASSQTEKQASASSFWVAAVLLCGGFGVVHLGNPGENTVGIAAAAVIGLFFCLTLRRTGNLWFAVGFHFSWDWGQSFLYSVRDSGTMAPGHLLHSSFHGPDWLTGGSVGPEGSVLVFVTIGVTAVVFNRVYPASRASIDDHPGVTEIARQQN